MKIENKIKSNIDNSDNQVQMLAEDSEILNSANMPFTELISSQYNNNACNSEQNLLSMLDIDYNYDSLTMSIEDALFFINLTKSEQLTAQNNTNGDFSKLIKTEIVQNVVSQRSVEVTNQLTNLIEKAMQKQKPVRISFDNNVSVVIKIDKAGKITAEFIPGSAEVENYLRSNIVSLRQKFEEQNLPYNDLFYRQNSRQNNRQNRNKGEKE